MSATVHLALHRNEGALLRLLGTVQRRGFEVLEVRTEPHEQSGLWRVALALAPSTRDLAVLLRQLERLYDVAAIERGGALNP